MQTSKHMNYIPGAEEMRWQRPRYRAPRCRAARVAGSGMNLRLAALLWPAKMRQGK